MSNRTLNRLPSLPTIAVEILRVFSDPDAPIQRVVELVQADPAIASKLLKAANSSRFGLAREVADLRQAVALMGKSRVTPIVLSFSLATESVESPEHTVIFKKYWLRCFVQATVGEVLGATYGPGFASESFTVNLLASLGQLGLLKQNANEYMKVIERAKLETISINEAETEVFGVNSRQLTLEMLEHAGLPERCIHAVAAIGNVDFQDEDQDVQRLGEIASVADAFARYMCDHDTGVALVTLQERMLLLESQAMTIDRLSEEVKIRIEESSSLFDLDPDQLPDPEELLADAMEHLAEFTSGINEKKAVPRSLLSENGRLKSQVQELLRQTSTDALTGIANRAFFDRRLSELTKESLRLRTGMGVAVVDIDHFKAVNDTYGHLAGDYVLKKVAASLDQVTRKNETLARYGGEEFAVLLQDVCEDGMDVFGERLRSSTEALEIVFEGTRIPVTISLGVACDIPTDADFGLTLFARADSALYKSKQNGRNQVTVDFRNGPSNKNIRTAVEPATNV